MNLCFLSATFSLFVNYILPKGIVSSLFFGISSPSIWKMLHLFFFLVWHTVYSENVELIIRIYTLHTFEQLT